jgi:hypothetical protein
MKVFEFRNADNQAYLYSSGDDYDRCDPNPPRAIGNSWSPPTFELVRSDEFHTLLPKTDFPTFLLGTMVLSERAVDRLRPILDACGEILPINLSNDRDKLYLFNVTRLIDVVDVERSKFFEMPSGAMGYCEALALTPTKIPHGPVFFKTNQAVSVTSLFATEEAVSAVSNARLMGHDFVLAWSDE